MEQERSTMAPDGRDAQIEYLKRDLAELQQRHDDLVEGLCRYIPDASGDERAVESIILEWASRATVVQVGMFQPPAARTYLALITLQLPSKEQFTRQYHVDPSEPEWNGTRYQVLAECTRRVLSSVGLDEFSPFTVVHWSLELMEIPR